MAINTINNGSSGANSTTAASKTSGGRPTAANPTTAGSGAAQIAAGDRLQLSSESQQLQQAAQNADAPVDSARVAELRAAIADGSYQVDAQRTAAKMLAIETDLSKPRN